ncbi:MAG: Ty1/Copia family ribonuclease HI [Bacteroidota bacterium]
MGRILSRCRRRIPEDKPVPKGRPARITCYVDADHAHDLVTRQSTTGKFIFIKSTPIHWISKRQKTVETSMYGSELVAAWIAMEGIIDLRYHLCMIGVPIEGPALMLGDNQSVILNTSVPSSILKEKHNAMAYHRVREAVAARIVKFAHIESQENLADCLTKPLDGVKFQ